MRNETMAPEEFVTLDQLRGRSMFSGTDYRMLEEEIHQLDGLGISFDPARLREMKQTPVFFGSAPTNFGVRLFLNAFIEFAPPPQPYESDAGQVHPGDYGR